MECIYCINSLAVQALISRILYGGSDTEQLQKTTVFRKTHHESTTTMVILHRHCLRICVYLNAVLWAEAWISKSPLGTATAKTNAVDVATRVGMFSGIFDDIGQFWLGETTSARMPYGKPLDTINTEEETFLAVQERGLSFRGEDHDVWSPTAQEPRYWVRGGCELSDRSSSRIGQSRRLWILNNKSQCLASVQKVHPALVPTYDLFRGDGPRKVGWMSKKPLTLFSETFEVFAEDDRTGLFESGSPIYTLRGDFGPSYSYTMHEAETDQVVARVRKNGWVRFDAFNHYQIAVRP